MMAISDLSGLRQHLQWAIEVEHTTLPPYLFALYSIKEGHNEEATEILRSIFMEEMLHMTLVANVLNAVGGQPVLDKPGFIAEYPACLPHSNKAFLVSLEGFSEQMIRTLMRIERPEAAGSPPEDDEYETIGQFYQAIEAGLKELCRELGESTVFSGDPSRQISADSIVYAGSGRIIPVTDMDSAIIALEEIMHQGEGLDYGAIWDGDHNMFHQEREEVGHYFRLMEILEGRRYQHGDTPHGGPTGQHIPVDWDAVHRPASNPRSTDHDPGSQAHDMLRTFGREYSQILRLLERGFNGEPECINRSVGAMYELKQLATELMALPIAEDGTTAGVCFEYQPEDPGELSREGQMIEILADGPYAIQGGIPLMHKSIMRSEHGEPLAWRTGSEIETLSDYALCRCGASTIKPFCDGSHATIGFDGTETAETGPSVERQKNYVGTGIVLNDDRPLCSHVGFCHSRVTDVWRMMQETGSTQFLIQAIGMIEHCPSGALTYLLDASAHESDSDIFPEDITTGSSVEPHLTPAIGVVPDGPLWVTGGVRILRSDGIPLEIRNRVTLCRCGHSKNKPFCDGSHAEIGFKG